MWRCNRPLEAPGAIAGLEKWESPWGFDGDLMVVSCGLMGFDGDLMVISWDLMLVSCGLMGFHVT